jgi:ubiquinone biosynthesis protein COQ4
MTQAETMHPETGAEEATPQYSNRMRPLDAWRAWKALVKDKEDTGQVFKMIDALKGKSIERATARVKASETGRRLLAEKPDIRALLNDREALRAMPEGSLGRAYLAFMEEEDLTADGLMDASFEAARPQGIDPDIAWVGDRLRDTHDLYHVTAGYGRDGLGELCVLAFGNEQTKNRGIRFLVFMGQRLDKKTFKDLPIAECINEAKTRGRNAAFLPAVDWEAMLPRQLEDVRRELKIPEPINYRETLPKILKIAEENGMLDQVA